MAWTGYALGAATVKLAARKIDRNTWKQAWDIHHPAVLLFSAIPRFGAFAYLAAKPVRSNRLLMRVALDAVMHKVPRKLYERTGLRRIIVRPAGAVVTDLEPLAEAYGPQSCPVPAYAYSGDPGTVAAGGD